MKLQYLLPAVIFISSFTVRSFAQQNHATIQGATLLTKDADVEGSSNFNNDWAPGSIITKDGKIINNLLLKYDIYNKRLLFTENPTNPPQIFDQPIRSFTLTTDHSHKFASGFPPVNGQKVDSYYEVLSEGKKTLLKYYKKDIAENKTYGSNETVKKFADNEFYYIIDGDRIIAVKNNKTGLAAQLADKQAQIDTYIKENKINFKKDEDLTKLFNYYNAL